MSDSNLTDSLRALVVGGTLLSVTTVLAQAFGFVETVVLTRALTVEDYGALSVGFTIAWTAGIFAQVGFGSGIKRYVSEYLERGDHHAVAGTVVVGSAVPAVVSGSLATVLFVGAGPLAARVFSTPGLAPVFRGFAVAVIGKTLLDVLAQLALALNRPGLSALAGGFGQSTLRVAAAVAVAVFGLTATGFAELLSVLVAVGALVGFTVTGAMLARIDGSFTYPLGSLATFSAPLALSAVAGRILSAADYILLGALTVPGNVGVYRPAFLLGTAVGLLFRSFNQMAYPLFTRLEAGDHKMVAAELLSVFLFWSFALTVPIFFWVILFAGELLSVFFGPAYVGGAAVLRVVAVVMIVEVIVGPVGTILEVHERTRPVFMSYLIAAGLNIGLNLLLIPVAGLLGAAVATAVSLIVLNGIQLAAARGLISFDRRGRRTTVAVLAAAILAGPFVVLRPAGLLVIGLSVPYFLAHLLVVIRLTEFDPADEELRRIIQDRLW